MMLKDRLGFSLLEVSVVIFVMGITITALLQMFEFGHLRYNAISSGLKTRSTMAEIRVWLRDKVANSQIEAINLNNLHKQINFPGQFRCGDLKISNYDADTYFIQLQVFEDRNSNGKAEKSESSEQKLFCFRRRNA